MVDINGSFPAGCKVSAFAQMESGYPYRSTIQWARRQYAKAVVRPNPQYSLNSRREISA